MVKISDLIFTSIETITAFDHISGDYLFTLDEIQNGGIKQSQEQTDITGKLGRKLSRLKKNKAVVVSGTNGTVSNGLIEVQTGSNFKDDTEAYIMWTDYLTVSGNSATTTYKATGTTGNEIENVYVKDDEGVIIKTLTQDSAVSADVFTYDPKTKSIAFNDGDVADNTEIVVYYKRKIKGSVHENSDGTFSKKAALYVDTFAEDKCGKIYRVQYYIPKADFSGEMTIDIGENQTVHAFEAEALGGTCGLSGNYWTCTIFGADAADVEDK